MQPSPLSLTSALDVAGADALHALARGLFAQLFDVVFGEVGQRLAVVELQLLQQ